MGRKDKEADGPKLASRRLNKEANVKIGRTISEKREHMETSMERTIAWKKGKRKKTVRVLFVILGFMVVFGILARYMWTLVSENKGEGNVLFGTGETAPKNPTIEVVDLAAGEHKITGRMNEFIAQAEQDFKDLGYQAVKAEIPAGSIRRVDFIIEGLRGRVRMTIDRDAAVSVEDADRMIRYLQGINVLEFEYIDVTVEEKGYWK